MKLPNGLPKASIGSELSQLDLNAQHFEVVERYAVIGATSKCLWLFDTKLLKLLFAKLMSGFME